MEAILIYLILEPESWIENSGDVTLYFTRSNRENYREIVKRFNLFTVDHTGCKNNTAFESIYKVKILACSSTYRSVVSIMWLCYSVKKVDCAEIVSVGEGHW